MAFVTNWHPGSQDKWDFSRPFRAMRNYEIMGQKSLWLLFGISYNVIYQRILTTLIIYIGIYDSISLPDQKSWKLSYDFIGAEKFKCDFMYVYVDFVGRLWPHTLCKKLGEL